MKRLVLPIFLAASLSLGSGPVFANAPQSAPAAEAPKDLASGLKQFDLLLGDFKLAEAEALLRQLLHANPEQHELLSRQGFLLLLQARDVEPTRAREMRKAARQALVKARDRGSRDQMVLQLIDAIPDDGGEDGALSEVPEADRAMMAAESAFSGHRYDEAIALYQEAARLDPGLYLAPLHLGDAWNARGDLAMAGKAYQQAIDLEPNKETAYRYWGDTLLRSDPERALQLYASAVVAEPNSQYAWERGLERWARTHGATLALPQVRPLSELSEDGKTILVDPSGKDTKSLAAWLAYSATRMHWRAEEFARQHPGEPYRPTLAEYSEALGKAAEITEKMEAGGELKPEGDLRLLLRLKREGMLEPFILLAQPAEGLGDDYLAYRQSHRDKLVRFVTDYIVTREEL